MYGYRRLGHNETDEPTFTQPVLYRKIARRQNVRESYLGHLLELNKVSRAEADKISDRTPREAGRAIARRARRHNARSIPEKRGVWADYIGGPEPADETGHRRGDEKTFPLAAQTCRDARRHFNVHPKLEHGLEARREMADGEDPLDWAAAEALALASLATEGVRIRFTGQDTGARHFQPAPCDSLRSRGWPYVLPLQHLPPEQAPVEIINSPLCETGALGFEYGYSLDCPERW